MRKYILAFIAIVVLFSGIASCKKETPCEGCSTKSNKPPIAVAGPDLTIFLPFDSVLLDGSGSKDPDGSITEWHWNKISGPASPSVVNNSVSKTVVKNFTTGVYLFELIVKDDGGLSAKDTVQVLVNASITPPPPQGPIDNVLFFFRDPTGSLDAANISVLESFFPKTILARVKIANFPDANIEGVWSLNFTPWCPISSIYTDATSYGTFNLPPGTYSWSAESVTTDISRFPGVPASFIQYWSTPHSASGTITVLPGTNCMIKEIIF